MYCKKCGKQLSNGMRFCPDCGTDNGVHTEKKQTKLFSNINIDKSNKLNIFGKESPEKETNNVNPEVATYSSIAIILPILGLLLIIFIPVISIVCAIVSIVFCFLAGGKCEKGSKEEKVLGFLVVIDIVLSVLFAMVSVVS